MSNRKKSRSTPLINYQIKHRHRLLILEVTNIAEVHKHFEHFLVNHEGIREELGQLTNEALDGLLGNVNPSGRRKSELVDAVWEQFGGTWHLAGTNQKIDVWEEEILKQTQADLNAFNDRRAREIEQHAARHRNFLSTLSQKLADRTGGD
ncbi:MAG: hypothetical protein QNK37_03410 [Acidobacteriota bacterium]|nr:hypothetical protein [Acidobacteriota bacterium]